MADQAASKREHSPEVDADAANKKARLDGKDQEAKAYPSSVGKLALLNDVAQLDGTFPDLPGDRQRFDLYNLSMWQWGYAHHHRDVLRDWKYVSFPHR